MERAAVDRPGIDPRWERARLAGAGVAESFERDNLPRSAARLEAYAATGQGPLADAAASGDEIRPRLARWEVGTLTEELSSVGHLRAYLVDRQGRLHGAGWDVAAASAAFAAYYTGEIGALYAHAMFPHRFKGRSLETLSLHAMPMTALGVLLGVEEAHRLARLQAKAHRAGWFFDAAYYPIFTFMLRLLADALEADPVMLRGESAAEPVFQALFDAWRTPDPHHIQQLCLAACDVHTRRCHASTGDSFHEFYDGYWVSTPIEIMLMFKLRHRLGLANPRLDHPLMDTPTATLPREVGFQPDPLIVRVRERMRKQGYDEAATADLVTTGKRRWRPFV